MTIQKTTNRSTIKTRSSAKREQQYKIAKYESIGKGSRTDPVSKQLTYEARKTPTRAANAVSRYASASVGPCGSSFSHERSRRSRSRTSIVLAQPVSVLSFVSPSKGFSTSTKKSSQVKRREILSPLASFSPNLRTTNRPLRIPHSETKSSLSTRGSKCPVLPTIRTPTLRVATPTVFTPSVEIRRLNDPIEEAPLKDAYPRGFSEFDVDIDEFSSDGDTPMKVYLWFITGYEDGAFSSVTTKGGSQYVPIIFSPTQDKSEDNPFYQAPAKVSMDRPKTMSIEEIDAELGEINLFNSWEYRLAE